MFQYVHNLCNSRKLKMIKESKQPFLLGNKDFVSFHSGSNNRKVVVWCLLVNLPTQHCMFCNVAVMWDVDAETQTGCHLGDSADKFAKDKVMASLEDNTTLGQKNT